jgi:CRISPR-associated protein Csm1
MHNEFNDYREKLRQTFHDIKKEEQHSGFLLKGDVSGIQEFIFNIPSDGAARMLKARSFFLQALIKLCIKKIQTTLNVSKIINDSGGSFYVLLSNKPGDKEWNQLQKDINEPIVKYGIYISLAFEKLGNWGNTNKNIITKEETLKYQRLNNLSDVFKTEKSINFDNEIRTWKAFAKKLSNAKGYSLKDTKENGIYENRLAFWGLQFILEEEIREGIIPFNSNDPSSFIMKEMPKWNDKNPYYKEYKKNDENSEIVTWENEIKRKANNEYMAPTIGDLIDLDHLTMQAKQRTGTDNLGVLKLDVDNLGSMFRDKFTTLQQYKNASDAFSFFFGKYLFEIWGKESFQDTINNEYTFKDNILIIYAGGDDCFILGGWDAVIEFSIFIKAQFDNFADEFLFKEKPISFSAGFLMVDVSYPIIRIGDLAEEMLSKAKNKDGKNAVCLFGETFSWRELSKIKDITNILVELIQGNPEKNILPESKSLVQKIRLSTRGYEALIKGITTKKKINIQKVWNFTWFILRGVKKENRDYIDSHIVSQYHDAVLKALMNQEYSSALVYPAAARLTELLIRKKQ